MPKEGLLPNNPEFYTPPEIYQLLEVLISTCQPVNEEEKKVYNASRENLEAFLKSQILDWTEPPEEIAEVFSQVPGYRADDPQRESRRQLSEQARAQILNFALNSQLSTDHISMTQREYYLLMNRSGTPQAHEENENIRKIMANGSPRERGRLFDACVKNCAGWFQKCFTGISDREIVENLQELQKAQDVAMEAGNIRNLTKEGLVEVSDETYQFLKYMEDNSPRVNAQILRLRAISNPTYEYIDIDNFLNLRSDYFDQLQDSVDGTTVGMWDYLKVISSVRNNESLVRADNKAAVMSSLEAVAQANKGFFIGSSAYSQAFRSLRSAAKFLENMDDFPNAEEAAQAKTKLEKTIQKCRAYLEKKNANPLDGPREKVRYDAMQRAMESCQQTLNFLDMKAQLKAAELHNDRKPESAPQIPVNPAGDVGEKIDQLYALKGKLVGLPISDAGMIGDELRADIYEKLNRLVSEPDAFDAEMAGYVMSNMVVLEIVKNGRGLNENGEITAGPIEKELAANPGAVLESLRRTEHLQSIMADVTPEKLNQFIMTDGAKTIADSMTKKAEQRTNSQNEQEVQMQKENSIIPQ